MKLDLSCYRMYDTIQLILSVIYVAYSNYFYTLHPKKGCNQSKCETYWCFMSTRANLIQVLLFGVWVKDLWNVSHDRVS